MNKRRFRDIAEELGLTVSALNEWLTAQRRGPFKDVNAEIDAEMEEFIHKGFNPAPPIPQNVWLREIVVGGFKAFAEEQRAPLGRITLVFGPNSAGKSSLLHSVLLAHEAVHTGELDVFEPRLAEGSIDLGGFKQFTHCQRTDSNPVILAFELRPNRLNEMFMERSGGIMPFRCNAVTVHVFVGQIPLNAEDDPQRGYPALIRLDISLDGQRVCQIGRSRDGSLRFRFVDLMHKFFVRLGIDYADLLRPVTAKPGEANERVLGLMQTVVENAVVQAPRDSVLPDSVFYRPTAIPAKSGPPPEHEPFTDPEGLTDDEHIQDFLEEEREEEEARFAKYFSESSEPDKETVDQLMAGFADVLSEFVRTACEPIRENLNALTYLGPLRSFPDRDFTLSHARDTHWHAGGGFAWDILAKDAHVRSQVNAWFASPFLKTPYQFVITDLVSGEIVSSAIESEFANIVQEKYEEHEKKRGSADEEDQEAFHFPYDDWDTDKLSKRLIDKAIERAQPSRRSELRLIDKRTGARVSHRDVGVGLSQILPILVRALSDTGKLHLIEQPEIHVHPALQAELADVFLNSALGDAQNRFVIETHSEHLILRILKRIRQTTAGETDRNQVPVRPEDVCVLYAEPTKEGTKLRHLRITPDGDFADRWPNGFFAERAAELFT